MLDWFYNTIIFVLLKVIRCLDKVDIFLMKNLFLPLGIILKYCARLSLVSDAATVIAVVAFWLRNMTVCGFANLINFVFFWNHFFTSSVLGSKAGNCNHFTTKILWNNDGLSLHLSSHVCMLPRMGRILEKIKWDWQNFWFLCNLSYFCKFNF